MSVQRIIIVVLLTCTLVVNPMRGAASTQPNVQSAVFASGHTQQTRPAVHGQFVAPLATDQITLDGMIDEWGGTWYEVSHLVYDSENYTGNSDVSGEFQVAWSDEGLLIGIRVRDDVYRSSPPGSRLFMGDTLEIQFDSRLTEDYSTATANDDDYQIGVRFGDDFARVEGYRWLPSSAAGDIEVLGAAAPAAQGYVVELLLPWSVFDMSAREVFPTEAFGFAISISDNDSLSLTQESLVSSSPARVSYNSPEQWGTLIMAEFSTVPSEGHADSPADDVATTPSVDAESDDQGDIASATPVPTPNARSSLSSATSPGMQAQDAFEPDNMRTAARPIILGQSERHTIHQLGDRDWIKFTPPDDTVAYTLTVQNNLDVVLWGTLWVKLGLLWEIETDRLKLMPGTSYPVQINADAYGALHYIKVGFFVESEDTPAGDYSLLITAPDSVPLPRSLQIHFEAVDPVISAGECTSLVWEVSGADMLQVEGEAQPNAGSREVCPATTTTYLLMASNETGVYKSTTTVTVEATAETPCHQLTVEAVPADAGTVQWMTPENCPDGGYLAGTMVELAAVAATPGLQFEGWSGDASGTEMQTMVTMDQDRHAVASFVPPDCSWTEYLVGAWQHAAGEQTHYMEFKPDRTAISYSVDSDGQESGSGEWTWECTSAGQYRNVTSGTALYLTVGEDILVMNGDTWERIPPDPASRPECAWAAVLVGTWQYQHSDRTDYMVFEADGTAYSYSVTSGGNQSEWIPWEWECMPDGRFRNITIGSTYWVTVDEESFLINGDAWSRTPESPWVLPCDSLLAYYDAMSREDIETEMNLRYFETTEELDQLVNQRAWYYSQYDVEYRDVECLERHVDRDNDDVEYVLVRYIIDFQKPEQEPKTGHNIQKMVFQYDEWKVAGNAPVFVGAPGAPYNLSPANDTVVMSSDLSDRSSFEFTWEGADVPAGQARFHYAMNFPPSASDLCSDSVIEVWGKGIYDTDFALIEESNPFYMCAFGPIAEYKLPIEVLLSSGSPLTTIRWRVTFKNGRFEIPTVSSDWHTLIIDSGPGQY